MSQTPIKTKVENEKVISILSYFTFFGWILAYLLNSPRSLNASFHLRQSLGINILFIASAFALNIPIIGWITSILGCVFGAAIWILGLISAFGGEPKTVPVVGDYFQELFQGL